MQRLRGAAALVRASRAVRQLASPAVAATPLAARSLASLVQRQSPGASPLAARAFSTKVVYPPSTAEVGKPAPDYSGTAVIDGEIKSVSMADTLKSGQWTVLCFYPKDFTFVCPTEIIAFSDRVAEFKKINATVIMCSTDTAESHLAWVRTPRKRGGLGHMQLPLLADVTKEISASYGTLLKDAGIALRGLFIIDPAGNLQQANINNLGVGRDVDEALRLVKAYQFVAEHGEVCPAGWTPGAATMIPTTDGAVSYFEKQADSAPDDDFNAQLPALKSEAEVTAAIAGPGPVVLDFYASWCGKCRQIAPHVEALMAEHKNVRVFKVDTDALPEVAAKYNASVLPTFSFFKGGKPALPPLQGYKKGPLAEAFASLAK